MTAPEPTSGLGLTEAEREALTEGACPDCEHRVIWHHDDRGCDYFGPSLDNRCHCRLASDAVVERILADRTGTLTALTARAEKAEAERDEWQERAGDLAGRAYALAAQVEAVRGLYSSGVGRDTNGVDRMIPATELRAVLDSVTALTEEADRG